MSERTNDREADEAEDGAVEFGIPHSDDNLDEIGQRYAQPTAPDLSKVVLEGDEVPEGFRGKSVSDLVTHLSRLDQALKVSEDARAALKASGEALAEARQGRQPAPTPQAPAPEPELNEEQLQALYDESPRKYQDYLAQQTEKRMLAAMRGQLAPVVSNTADMALREARQRFPDEFSAFGKDVEKFVSELPDRSVLTAPGAVDQMMDYLRGRNWKAFDEYRASQRAGGLESARKELASQTPADFSRSPQQPPPARRNGGRPVQLDDTMKQIADLLGVSYEDYAKGLTDRDLRMIRSYGNR